MEDVKILQNSIKRMVYETETKKLSENLLLLERNQQEMDRSKSFHDKMVLYKTPQFDNKELQSSI
jgi:hypothetical protein